MDMLSFWLVVASVILFIAYAILISYYKNGWGRCPEFEIPANFLARTKVTVIVPARNEELNIESCLLALHKQTYPATLLEILVIDDHSEDRTAEIVKKFPAPNIRLISLSEFIAGEINSYKKKAIEVAIRKATGDWIITTDADCTAGPKWVEAMVAFQEAKGAAFVAAPVKLMVREKLLGIFQALDFITLQGITAASIYHKFHVMANGANLGYSKALFLLVGGFENIDGLASGDDMLLMQKFREHYPDKIFYLKNKEAIVTSLPAKTFKEFLHQRIRWASKAGKYRDTKILAVLLLVYFFNLFLFSLFVVSIWKTDSLFVAVLLLICKTIVEFPFVNLVARFFGQNKLMFYFLFLQPAHVLYIIGTGLLGKFGKFEWKGRKVK